MAGRGAWLVALWLIAAIPAAAQQIGLPRSAILTITSERLFADSQFGKRVAREIEAEGQRLATENRRIEGELTAEEKALTDSRPDMTPEEFRKLADAFDKKVQEIRRTQDAKARHINQQRDEARAAFFDAARPILAEVMRDAGAGVILERSSVFLSANATDVTDLAIARVDAAFGRGHVPAPPEE